MPEEMSTKEIKNSRSDEVSGEAYKKVLIKTARILAATLPLPLLTACAACEKPPVVEEQQQEEEKAEVIIPSETKEETKETPPVVEETPEKIEWEGITFSPIEGLRFDKGTFYFMKGNEYGGVVGERAGVLIPKDAVEINGVMQAAFGFVPKVLEVMQKKIMEEKKEFRYPLPFNFEEAKGIKIKEVANTQRDDYFKSQDTFWDNNTYLEVSNVPLGAKIHAPVSTSHYLIWDNTFIINNPSEPSLYGLYWLCFRVIASEADKEGLLFRNERVDVAELSIDVNGVSLLPLGIEKNIVENEDGGYSFLTKTGIGEPIAEVVSEEDLPFFPSAEPGDSDVRSIMISYDVYQLIENEKSEMVIFNFTKASKSGLTSLLKIENIPVFISP